MKKLTEDQLWQMAEKRVAFRRHFFIYIIINILIFGLWYITFKQQGDHGGYWFIYPMLGWGIGLAFHYWAAYNNDMGAIENEYKKVKEKFGDPDESSDHQIGEKSNSDF